MTRPYRDLLHEVGYYCLPDEGALLARTTQRYRGVLKSGLATGRITFTSMYGHALTPFADDLLTSIYGMHRWDAALSH